MSTSTGDELNVAETSSGIPSLMALYLEQKRQRLCAWANVDQDLDRYLFQLLDMTAAQFKISGYDVCTSLEVALVPEQSHRLFRQSVRRWNDQCPMMKVCPNGKTLVIYLSRQVAYCPEGTEEKYQRLNLHLIKIRNACMEPWDVLLNDVQMVLEEHQETIKSNPREALCVASRQTEKWIQNGRAVGPGWYKDEYRERFPFVDIMSVTIERRLANKFRKVAYLTFRFNLE